jgi:hypothetical protein
LANWSLFALLVLAVYRLTQFIVYDDAPFDLMVKIRTVAGVYRVNERGQREGFWAKLLYCPYCVGLWLALFVAVAAYPWPEFVIYWLAIAGGQAFLQGLSQ